MSIDVTKALNSKKCVGRRGHKIKNQKPSVKEQDKFDRLLLASKIFREMCQWEKKLYKIVFMNNNSTAKKKLKITYKRHGLCQKLLDG